MATTTTPPIPRSGESRTPASTILRALTVALALAAVGLIGYQLSQGVQASRLDRDPIGFAGATATLEVTGFTTSGDLQASVLGLANAERRDVGPYGIIEDLGVPDDGAYLVALTGPGEELIGLVLALPGATGRPAREIRVTPTTTAQALLALAPGVLTRDEARLADRIASLSAAEDFSRLVQTVRASDDLRQPDQELEVLLAQVIDATLSNDSTRDQGCDSVSDERATARVGACFAPTTRPNELLVMNEQIRWLLVFRPTAEEQLCALIPPSPGSGIVTTDSACGTTLDFAAPGPVAAGSEPLDLAQRRGLLAGLVTAYSEFTLPFADLAAGASGANRDDAIERIAGNPGLVGSQFSELIADNPNLLASAEAYADPSATPSLRLSALTGLTRAALRQPAIATALLADSPNYEPGPDDYDLLDLYDRVIARHSSDGAVPNWSSDAFRRIDLTTLATGG